MRQRRGRSGPELHSRGIRQLIGAATLAALALAGLTSCAVGQPSGFTARSNATCASASAAIAKLAAASDPPAALRYALDRYVIVEKAVSTLTDSSLPNGQLGDELRDRWLRLARASLATATTTLEDLRQAVRHGNRDAAASAFAAAVITGAAGVDAGYLRSQRLDRCAALFTPAIPATTW